ncbi:MAG: hypothetical protein AAFY76_25180, partial [Cyanobacteria bacterium J06649_11]
FNSTYTLSFVLCIRSYGDSATANAHRQLDKRQRFLWPIIEYFAPWTSCTLKYNRILFYIVECIKI